MKASALFILLGFVSLTVSCAHKTTETEIAVADKPAEVKVDVQDKSKEEKKELAYTCLVGKDKRLVTIDKNEKRCEVFYTKFGDEKQVAWAESTPSICEEAFGKIRTNIEGSGYKYLDGLNVSFDDTKKESKEENKEEKKSEETTKPVETAATQVK